jgi:hypothetical protein
MTILRQCDCTLEFCPHPRSEGDPRCTNIPKGAEIYCDYCQKHRQAAKVEATKQELKSK